MKTISVIAIITFILFSHMLYGQRQDIDVEKSNIEWLGKRLGVKHFGVIQLKSGYLMFMNDDLAGGKFVVDMNSIKNIDLQDKADNDKLVNHLKSDDFFSVEKYPTAELVVLETKKFVNNKAIIKGRLTIKNSTEDIEFKVVREGNIYRTEIDIDRSKFDVRFGSNTFFDNLGDNAISDIFTLAIKIVME